MYADRADGTITGRPVDAHRPYVSRTIPAKTATTALTTRADAEPHGGHGAHENHGYRRGDGDEAALAGRAQVGDRDGEGQREKEES
jgi:hypothetical protein